MESSCVIAASSNPETVNPKNDFNTLLKTEGNMTEGRLQNAKPSWMSVEKTMAAVIQMLLPLTVGG